MKSLKEQTMEGKINPALPHLTTGAKVRSNTCSDHDDDASSYEEHQVDSCERPSANKYSNGSLDLKFLT